MISKYISDDCEHFLLSCTSSCKNSAWAFCVKIIIIIMLDNTLICNGQGHTVSFCEHPQVFARLRTCVSVPPCVIITECTSLLNFRNVLVVVELLLKCQHVVANCVHNQLVKSLSRSWLSETERCQHSLRRLQNTQIRIQNCQSTTNTNPCQVR